MSDGPRQWQVSRRAVWAAAAAFWIFVAAVSAAQIALVADMPGQRGDMRGAIMWQTAYLLGWIPFTIAVLEITRGWLPERFGGWGRLLLAHSPLFIVVALAHPLIVTVCAVAFGHENMGMAATYARQLRGQLTAQVLVYTAIAVTGASITLSERYRDRQVVAAQLEAELSAARLQALRAHLQPHFLFNSLHSIAALARAGDTAGVVRLIASLSDLLRHVLDAGDGHSSLRDEMYIVERYLDIQRARFADRLEVTVDLAPNVADARVPLLIVQPLVENAVRHGLAQQVRHGSLIVRAMRDNGLTRIVVEDTGVGLPTDWSLDNGNGTGLRNLASRLIAEFGNAAALDVQPREGGGVRATVTLPYTSV
jgi:two-component system, LytTR family, sensor kinase